MLAASFRIQDGIDEGKLAERMAHYRKVEAARVAAEKATLASKPFNAYAPQHNQKKAREVHGARTEKERAKEEKMAAAAAAAAAAALAAAETAEAAAKAQEEGNEEGEKERKEEGEGTAVGDSGGATTVLHTPSASAAASSTAAAVVPLARLRLPPEKVCSAARLLTSALVLIHYTALSL